MSTVFEARPVPSPALLARTPRVSDARSFDIASELGDTAVAWRIRDLTTGEEEQFLFSRVRGEEVLGQLIADVSGWVAARTDGAPAVLRCFSIAMRLAVSERLDPARFQLGDLIQMNTSLAWSTDARVALRAALRAHETLTFKSSVLYGASDGSAHPTYGMGAFAWVTHDGHWHTQQTGSNILGAEVRAILSFARHFTTTRHAKAVLFVDSLNAIDVIMSDRIAPLAVSTTLLAQTRQLIRARQLELIWVRSHDGQVINEVADRLALQRHRAIRAGLSPEQLQRLCWQIVDSTRETFADTDWRAVAEAARCAHRRHLRARDHAA